MTGADVQAAASLQAAAMPNPWSVAQFIDVLRPSVIAWVVDVGAIPVAAVGVANQTDLLTIAVDVRCRRRGYAVQLLGHLLNVAAAHGAREYFLEVMEGNDPALALYHRFGFIAVGMRRRYYQLPDGARDAIVMRAVLAEGDDDCREGPQRAR